MYSLEPGGEAERGRAVLLLTQLEAAVRGTKSLEGAEKPISCISHVC